MNIVGIDTGGKGALACIGDSVTSLKMPMIGPEIDGAAMKAYLEASNPSLIVIEKVHSMPKQGVRSTFTFGTRYGFTLGMVAALGFPFVLVTPQTWKSAVLSGTKKDKHAACNFVARRYPEIELIGPRCTKPHDGIADAVCIAHYGKIARA